MNTLDKITTWFNLTKGVDELKAYIKELEQRIEDIENA